ncbi:MULTISPECIES: FAD-binding oxidoreductase [unclassified Pseudomonas]|uniref:FAD-binding oxidoreductase n=1 Tax=unclassified Pseudomonas TaxID=196821 RepID=UPI000BD7A350|nr:MULTISPECIES: BBE domain-containing protein [unclassified Pseudomonas]PVZ16046.1 FAD binding domain-containing protein [Pseudomonas sp. URIL14HWK12:I12]PVZ26098.1 FAD binding domain-containing protein [Pseudomonas sp. URIL14HWK12:I10]PVZ36378.1 FAD binding domain-containing protein [Pseudomonas sp. URIL14HWK12:I11]SNZ18440.1 FAD/FMN-containing dehydrogenases [Pseudomonas sp. URIL14HWK12:I9]
MPSYVKIDTHDTRHVTLQKGFNLRWPTAGGGADFIYVCSTAEQVADAANDALAGGCRITVRSGGHCYEGLVANKLPGEEGLPLAIIDIGQMTGMAFDEARNITSPYYRTAPKYLAWLYGNDVPRYRFRIAAGSQNWAGYVALYKAANRVIPGGSCYSVGAGGHICGGGYGLLSRLHGLTVDWLSAVDILVPDPEGKALLPRHVHRRSDGVDKQLFTACCGAGGGNFGIILNYYFDDLPKAPEQSYWLTLSWPWERFANAAQLGHFLRAYWQWFSDHDAHWNSSAPHEANGGLFSLLKLQHRSTGDINLLVQYTGVDGRVDGEGQTEPFERFIQHMIQAAGSDPHVSPHHILHGPVHRHPAKQSLCKASDPLQHARLMDWLYLTQMINGSGSNQCGKYKSFYQITNFGTEEIDAIWEHLYESTDPALSQALLQIDSYGGAINHFDHQGSQTSVAQRHSLLKSQLQVYWASPEHEQACLNWCRAFYIDYFKRQGGKPYADNGNYEGCYINYPDVDMKYLDHQGGTLDTRWLELYYGRDLARRLIDTKRAIDPHNVFRSELSIPLSVP